MIKRMKAHQTAIAENKSTKIVFHLKYFLFCIYIARLATGKQNGKNIKNEI